MKIEKAKIITNGNLNLLNLSIHRLDVKAKMIEQKKKELLSKVEDYKEVDDTVVMKRVRCFSDVLRLAKLTKEEKKAVSYSGKSKLLKYNAEIMKCILIAKVLNNGWSTDLEKNNRRIYIWAKTHSGCFIKLAYGCSVNGIDMMASDEFCFKNEILADFAIKKFGKIYKNALGIHVN